MVPKNPINIQSGVLKTDDRESLFVFSGYYLKII
jgi:hypothetical protein